ncbi:MAG: thiosulfate oxidation carrier protein SoxY [Hyphomicrobium sp.]|nr:thiosulfate oxidation carrier protein SoxY [Hyphomicrobium sp.]
MRDRSRIVVIDRRTFTAGSGAALAVAVLTGRAAFAETPSSPATPPPSSAPAPHSAAYEDAMKSLLAGAEPATAGLTLELPELAENGNVVPYKIAADSPMLDEDYIRKLHILSTANPQPLVASFELIPATGKAMVSGRMRLAKTQNVVGLAEKSDGTFLIATALVEVTIGGCGNE